MQQPAASCMPAPLSGQLRLLGAEPDTVPCVVIAGALEGFEAILKDRPGDAVACNNAAICQLYACNLKGGLHRLEHSLAEHPETVLKETVLLNLSSMYNLSSSAASTEAKRKLGAWASSFATDDVDLTCIRTA